MTLYHGWTESEHNFNRRNFVRRMRHNYTADPQDCVDLKLTNPGYLAEMSLDELMITCLTDGAHVNHAHAEPDGTEPSPYISGGEVTYPQPYKTTEADETMPF